MATGRPRPGRRVLLLEGAAGHGAAASEEVRRDEREGDAERRRRHGLDDARHGGFGAERSEAGGGVGESGTHHTRGGGEGDKDGKLPHVKLRGRVIVVPFRPGLFHSHRHDYIYAP